MPRRDRFADVFADVRRRLLAQAPLFEDARAYQAGVEDTLDALSAALQSAPAGLRMRLTTAAAGPRRSRRRGADT